MRVTSEGPAKITKGTIDAAWRRRVPGNRLILRDRDCRGLALIVNPTRMTWTYAYRPRGIDPLTGRRWPNRTVTLGNPQTHSADDARAEANRIKGQAAGGADPAAEKKARAADEQRKRGATVKRLLKEYETTLPHRPKMRGTGLPSAKYVAEEIAQTRQGLLIMEANDIPANNLSVAEVRKLLRRASDGAATARARFGSVSRFLDWCQDSGHIMVNPCALIGRARRPKAPQARSHYLPISDLARLWEAADRLREPVWRDLVRFLIAMPCRRGEARKLDWSHIDMQAAEWRQPGHMTKNRDAHRLHLHSLALGVLRERHRATGGKGLIFPAPVSGGPVDTFTNMKAELVEITKLGSLEGDPVDGWTWHDFRRSFASALGEAGTPEAVADPVLNHRQAATRGGVLGIYQRSSRWPEQVRALVLWGRLLTEALDGSEASINLACQ
jgi:integrase